MSRWSRWTEGPPPPSRLPRAEASLLEKSADIAVDEVVDLLLRVGLAHMLVGALLLAPELVAVGLLRGDEDDGDVRGRGVCFEGAAGLEAVLSWHHDVEEDHGRLRLLGDLDGLATVAGVDGVMPGLGHDRPQQLAVGLNVVDNQYRLHGSPCDSDSRWGDGV